MKRCNIWKDEDDQPSKKKLKNIAETSSESESSDDESDICVICLGKLYKGQVGNPEGCDHVFCLKCILEWSKSVNTCPVDRQPFQIIFARESIHDNSAIIINVQPKDNRDKPEEVDENDVTVCEICSQGDREDRLLLCDGCNKGYHLDCLNPPLDQVPNGDWFCEDCEVISPWHDHQQRNNRMIARTLIYERVLRNIRRIESSDDEDDSDEDDDELREFEEEESENEVDVNDSEHEESLNITSRVKQTSTRSRRKKKSSGKRKKRKSSKRRKKKSDKKMKRLLSCVYGESSNSKQNQFEQNSLSIYGNRLTLHNFKDEAPIPSTSSSRKSHVSKAVSAPKPEGDKKSFDILGDILNGQALLHSRSSDIAISRDGSLKPLKQLPDMRLLASNNSSNKSTFFLTDISSKSMSPFPSPSTSSTSSPQSSPSFPNTVYHRSRSRFSDFSESSDDSCHARPLASYEESYRSLTNEIKNKSKDKNESENDRKNANIGGNLFDKPGEYSPVCGDDDSQVSSGDSSTTDDKISSKNQLSPGKNGRAEEETIKEAKHSPVDIANKSNGSDGRACSSLCSDPQGKAGDQRSKLEGSKISTSLEISSSSIGSLSNNSYSVLESTMDHHPDATIKMKVEEEESDRKKEEEDYTKMDMDIEDDDYYDDNEDEVNLNKNDNLRTSEACSTSKKEEQAKKLSSVEKLMQDALKSFYMSKQINKEDYKLIMRNGVSKIMKSRDKRVEPAKVQRFVNQYVVSVLKKKLP